MARRRAMWLVVVAAAFAAPAEAAPLPRYGVLVYSSLCGDPVGDIAGSSLTLKRTPQGDTLTYDYSEGALFGSTIKHLRIRGDHLTATAIPGSGGGEVELSATFNDREAVLTLKPAPPATVKPPPERLPRVKRLPRRVPDCR